MNKILIEKFLEYANTEESQAVLFVKKYLNASNGYWVDIISCNKYLYSDAPLAFKNVTCELFKRTITPQYPSKSKFTTNGGFDEIKYILEIRAITWATANKDIEKQRNKNIKGKRFVMRGVSYPKKNKKFFIDSAPPEIKKLADNINDRTDPLWEKASNYIDNKTFVYELKSVKRID